MSLHTHTGKHKMFKKLLSWLNPSQQSALEAFINSKRPTNAAEVEYWTHQYEQGNGMYWGRGL